MIAVCKPGAAAALAGLLVCAAALLAEPAGASDKADADAKPDAAKAAAAMTLDTFLDRLMIAESGGRDDARNSRSSAVGPYQFIRSTFLDIAARHFVEETAKLAPAAVLLLRTNRTFARRAAEIYTKENAASLAAAGIEPTFPRLRLAFLLGPGSAIRVLSAPPQTPMVQLVSRAVIFANPFMSRLTAAGLVARAARDLEVAADTRAGINGGKIARAKPAIPVRCNLALASCQRWLALAKSRLAKGLPVAARRSASRR